MAEPQRKGKQMGRFNPTVLSLILAIIAVGIGGYYALSVLSKPIDNSLFGAFSNNDEVQSTAPPIFEETPTPTPTPATPGAPVIAGVDVFSWRDDGNDHPELSSALTDGNPDTLWYTRYYDWNQFEENNTIALLVNLTEESRVNEIVLDLLGGEGEGEISIRVPENGNPRVGKVLVTSPITAHTVIKLPENTDVSSLGINFVRLPLDDEGIPRAKVTSLTIN